MNETIVAKGLVKHLAEKYAEWGTGTSFTDGIIVHNKAQTAEHGYTSGCATILWEEGPRDPQYDSPWTYDVDRELVSWVQAKYGKEYWLEAYSGWMLCVIKD